MQVFVTGGSGLTGPAIVAELIAAGARAADGVIYLADQRAASSARTRGLLGWTPTHDSLLDDLATGDYFAAQGAWA